MVGGRSGQWCGCGLYPPVTILRSSCNDRAGHLVRAVPDHRYRDVEHHQEAEPGDPAVALQHARHQIRRDTHQHHRQQQAGREHPCAAARRARHGQHVVQAHRQVGQDDLEHGLAERLARRLSGGVAPGTAQLSEHAPAHPKQQQAAGQEQADHLEQLQCDGAERDTDCSGAGDSKHDRGAPASGGQPRDGHSHHHGVIAGEGHVDRSEERQGGEVLGQRKVFHLAPALVRRWCSGLAGATPGRDSAAMVPRYTRPQMEAIWSPANRYRIWFEIEALAAEGMALVGAIPESAARNIRQKGGAKVAAISQADIDRIDEIERETRHDVIAFLTWLAEAIGEDSRFVHQGMTSSDVLDTCLSVQLAQAGDLLLGDLDEVLAALKTRALEHKYTLTIGRSHGIHAEPTTFGLKLAGHYAEFARDRARLVAARAEIAVAAISGAVGTYAHIDPRVEAYVAEKLGLAAETVSTQVIPRDRHAMFFAALAVIASGIERLATEVRHLQRSEVREAEEFFHPGQKGSSAMPHKRNPVLSENLTGLARVVRSAVVPALENVTLWHERDISHSSVERVIAPDATIALDFALARLAGLIDGLVVYEDKLRRNLDAAGELYFSQRVLLALTQKGMSREDSYAAVQRNAMRAWEKGLDFLGLLKSDPEVAGRIKPAALEALFDDAYHTKHVDTIFKRVFGAS